MNGRETLEEKARLGRGRAHTVELTTARARSLPGVADVEAFNEEEVVLLTDMGVIVLSGEGLHIVKLNLDEGVLAVEGRVIALEYVQDEKAREEGPVLRPVQVSGSEDGKAERERGGWRLLFETLGQARVFSADGGPWARRSPCSTTCSAWSRAPLAAAGAGSRRAMFALRGGGAALPRDGPGAGADAAALCAAGHGGGLVSLRGLRLPHAALGRGKAWGILEKAREGQRLTRRKTAGIMAV